MFAIGKIFIICITVVPLLCATSALCAPVSGAPHPENMSGRDWQRVFNPGHPEAPPRLVLKPSENSPSANRKTSGRSIACVRAGDRLVVHEAAVRASTLSLAARALESGACGARIRARIAVTGGVAEVTVAERGVGFLEGRERLWR